MKGGGGGNGCHTHRSTAISLGIGKAPGGGGGGGWCPDTLCLQRMRVKGADREGKNLTV